MISPGEPDTRGNPHLNHVEPRKVWFQGGPECCGRGSGYTTRILLLRQTTPIFKKRVEYLNPEEKERTGETGKGRVVPIKWFRVKKKTVLLLRYNI